MEEQIQIYLLSGIFGGVCLILLICVVALFCMVRKLKNGTSPNNKRQAGGRDNDSYAYNNPTLQPDEELSRRGFVMHDIGKLPRVQNDAIQPQQQQQHRPSEFKNNYREYSANQQSSLQERKISTKALPNDFTDILNNDDIVFGGGGNQPSKSQPKTSLIQQQSDRYNSPASSSAAPRLSQFNNNILYGNTNLNNNTNNNNQYLPAQQQSTDDKPFYNNNRAINNMY